MHMCVRVIQRVKSVQVTVVLSSWLSLRGGPNHKFLVDFCVNYSTESTCTSGEVTEGDLGESEPPICLQNRAENFGCTFYAPYHVTSPQGVNNLTSVRIKRRFLFWIIWEKIDWLWPINKVLNQKGWSKSVKFRWNQTMLLDGASLRNDLQFCSQFISARLTTLDRVIAEGHLSVHLSVCHNGEWWYTPERFNIQKCDIHHTIGWYLAGSWRRWTEVRLIDVWYCSKQSVIDDAVDEWRKCLCALILVKERPFWAFNLTPIMRMLFSYLVC